MAHNSFSPGLRTPDLAPSRANLPLLSASRANVPFFCTKVTANCDFEDDSDLDIGYYCTEIIPRKAIKQGLKDNIFVVLFHSLYLSCFTSLKSAKIVQNFILEGL